MYSILSRAGCFVAIILMGIILRRVGFFQKEDFNLLSKIVIKITLTCAIITSFSGRELEYSMFVLTAIGFSFGILMMSIAYVLNIRRGSDAQAFAIQNSTGCNIGNFALPFAQNFLGPLGVMAVSLFDVGNSLWCLGGAFGVASIVKESNKKVSLKPVFRAMSKSVPLITYLLMTLLAILHISLPAPVMEFAGIVGNSNAFLAMLMIGVGFQLSADRKQLASVFRIVLPRYVTGITLAVCSFLFLPFPLEYRQALVLVFLAPMASAAPSFTLELGGDYGLACAVNSICIIISIVLIMLALLLVL